MELLPNLRDCAIRGLGPQLRPCGPPNPPYELAIFVGRIQGCDPPNAGDRPTTFGGTRPWFRPTALTLEAFSLHQGQWLLIAILKDDDAVSIPPFDAITF